MTVVTKMTKMGWAMALGIMAVWTISACSDDSGSVIDVNKTCADFCTKQVSCDPSDQTQGECEADCRKMIPKMNDGFVTAGVDCITGHSCEELDDGVCEHAGRSYCTTDTRPLYEQICSHSVGDCQGGDQDAIDACVTSQLSNENNEMFQCFKTSALDDLGDCMAGLDCQAGNAEIQACFESSLGIKMEK